jgi:hypothetical protein
MRAVDWRLAPGAGAGIDRIRSFLTAYPERAVHLRPLLICLVLSLLSVMASTDSQSVWLLGFRLPPLCPFKFSTDLDCPGCGITRALIFVFHGRFRDATMMHIWGIPLALLILAQIPYRITLIALNRPSPPSFMPGPVRPWINRFVLLSILLPWLAKLAFLVPIRWF